MRYLFFILFIYSTVANSSPLEPFSKGIQFYNSKNYAQAKETFLELNEQYPNNSHLLYNLALTEYRLGEVGRAIAHLRRALSLEPTLVAGEEALKHIQKNIGNQRLPYQTSFQESLRSNILIYLSFSSILLFLLIFFLGTGWIFLNYVTKRTENLKLGKTPPRPSLSLLIFGLGFLLSLSLLFFKHQDFKSPRATVVTSGVSAMSGPGEDYGALFDLFEGAGVIVQQLKGDWAQVTYPGGGTGWVKTNTLIHTSGKNLW